MTDAPGSPAASVGRVGLALGGIVLAAVVIFALGVMEGSRVAERVPPVAAPPDALPTEILKSLPVAAVEPAAPVSPDKLTFYDRLSGVVPPAPVALPEGQAPAPGFPPAASPEAQGTPARRPETPAPATAAAAPRKAAAAATAAAAVRTAVPSKADATAQIRKLAGKGRFTVQMAAVAERAAATELTALIKRNGFDAVTATTSVKGKNLYRIRVGSFPNKQAAAQAAGIFRSAFGLEAIAMEN